ncbi:MAG TPA: MoxR family ATPase [Candidatus Acidoferrum sp.]|nr:MoxR family ATPase [Candidatus Acidoferrum sp.]
MFLNLAEQRMENGLGAVLLLKGPPGGGKTSFGYAMAEALGAECIYYGCKPDKERDLLYEIDVQGVLDRVNAWAPGKAWQAFKLSAEGKFCVLILDELDKASPDFDAFLLELLENWRFTAPGGVEVGGDPKKLAIILTTNDRRKLRPELLRRCQRISVPIPENGRREQIIRQLAGIPIPDGLLSLVVRIGEIVRKDDEENAPSPKEMAMCCVDLLHFAQSGCYHDELWREVGASWLTKGGGVAHLDKLMKFGWGRGLMNEARK